MKTNLMSLKSKRGFTLVEIICVVVLIGILGAVGLSFMRDTAQTGRANAGAANARELETAIINLRAAGATITIGGSSAVTQGSATTAASVTIGTGALSATDPVAVALAPGGTGITSYGNTVQLTRQITWANYEVGGTSANPTVTHTVGSAP